MKRLFVLLAVPVLLLSGCGSGNYSLYANYREIEDLLLVQTMGFDGTPGQMTVSVSSRQSTGGSNTILTTQGISITGTARQLQAWVDREDLFFAHVQYAVMGEDAARGGVENLLDYFERSTQTRLDLPLFIVRGGTAEELVSSCSGENYEITTILASLQRDAERRGSLYCFTLRDIAQRLASSGAALCCAVKQTPVKDHVPSAEEGASTAVEAGYAVLKDGKLAAFLDPDTSLGVNLLLNRSGTEALILPSAQGGFVTVQLDSGHTRITPRWDENGELSLHVHLKYQAGIVEVAPSEAEDAHALDFLNREFSLWLEASAQAALEAARDTGADFLEVGRTLQRSDPKRYAALNWSGFPAGLRWEIEAEGTVARSYEISGVADTAGEGRDHV